MQQVQSLKKPNRRKSASRSGQMPKWPPVGLEPHKPVWVEVNVQTEEGWVKENVQVDEGIVELVTALNTVEGLQTIDSCQGWPGADSWYRATVGFYYGDWKTIRRFLFEEISPALKNIENTSVTAKFWSRSDPLGAILMAAEALPDVTRALNLMLNRRKNKCSCGADRKTLELPF